MESLIGKSSISAHLFSRIMFMSGSCFIPFSVPCKVLNYSRFSKHCQYCAEIGFFFTSFLSCLAHKKSGSLTNVFYCLIVKKKVIKPNLATLLIDDDIQWYLMDLTVSISSSVCIHCHLVALEWAIKFKVVTFTPHACSMRQPCPPQLFPCHMYMKLILTCTW